jgi:hypothetical protein
MVEPRTGELVTYEPTVVGTVLRDAHGNHWTLRRGGLWGSEASIYWKTWDALRSCWYGKRLTFVSQPPVDDEGWRVAVPEVVTVDQVEIGDDVEIAREVIPGVRASWSGRVVRKEKRTVTLGGPGHGAHLSVMLDGALAAPVIRRIRRASEPLAPAAVRHAGRVFVRSAHAPSAGWLLVDGPKVTDATGHRQFFSWGEVVALDPLMSPEITTPEGWGS